MALHSHNIALLPATETTARSTRNFLQKLKILILELVKRLHRKSSKS